MLLINETRIFEASKGSDFSILKPSSWFSRAGSHMAENHWRGRALERPLLSANAPDARVSHAWLGGPSTDDPLRGAAGTAPGHSPS